MFTLCKPRTVLQRFVIMHRGGRQGHERLDQTFSRSLGASQTAYHGRSETRKRKLVLLFSDPDPVPDLP
jgi:hypothetical protein